MRGSVVAAALWLLAALACVVGLGVLAQWQLRQQLRAEAVAFLSTLAQKDTPYRWRFQDRNDLVGSRVFGDCRHSFEANRLRLHAGSKVCELGLPLRNAVDLGRFDQLRITSQPAAPAFTLLLREQLDQLQCHAEIPAGGDSGLAALHWRHDDRSDAATPRRAAMLRLRFADLGEDLILQQVSLMPAAGFSYSAPEVADWQPLHSHSPSPSPAPALRVPLYAADDSLAPAALLLARDQLREREPAALVLYHRDAAAIAEAVAETVTPGPPAPASPLRSWLWLLAAAGGLAALRWRPPGGPHLAPILLAAAAVALPLFLVAGLRIGDNIDNWTLAALALALIYAASLSNQTGGNPMGTPRAAWLGTPRAWLLASLAPAASLLLIALDGRPDAFATLNLAGFPAYVLWALLQQWLICSVFARQLHRSGLATAWVALAAALVFALLHAPNAGLMLVTFAGGLLWTAIWLRDGGLLPIALSHALAACLLVGRLRPDVLRSAEVSLRYFL